MLLLHSFYKAVRDNSCFYVGFLRLSANNVVFILLVRRLSAKNQKNQCHINIFRGQPTRYLSAEKQQQVNCPPNSPSFTIESPLARPHSFASPRPLARTHERNETISRLAVSQKDSPPQPPIFAGYVYCISLLHSCIAYLCCIMQKSEKAIACFTKIDKQVILRNTSPL